MSRPLDVQPDALDAAAGVLAAGAAAVSDLATTLQASCLAPPRVGDVQAAAAFGQAHYDWVQTRFEDLVASADELAHHGQQLAATAQRYRGADTGAANGLGEAPGGRP